jgi:hypothetical protein
VNSFLWSAFVNLLASGISAATARTTISGSVCQDSADKSAAVTLMTNEEAAMVTQAKLAPSARATWYLVSSPYQLGATLPP